MALSMICACNLTDKGAQNTRTDKDAQGGLTDGEVQSRLEEQCVGVTPPQSMFLPLPDASTDAGAVDATNTDADDAAQAVEMDSSSSDAGETTDSEAATDSAASSPDTGAVEPPRDDPCGGSPGTCIGQAAAQWALFDFQPRSCGYEATYGLDQFVGHVTVVALLAAW